MKAILQASFTVGISLAFGSCSKAEPLPVSRDISQCGDLREFEFAVCLLEASHEREGLMIIKYLAAHGDERATKLLGGSGTVNDVILKESPKASTP